MPSCPINKELDEFEDKVVLCISIVAACSIEQAQEKWDAVDYLTRNCIIDYSPDFDLAHELDNRFLVALRNSIEEVPAPKKVLTYEPSRLIYLTECRVSYALQSLRVN